MNKLLYSREFAGLASFLACVYLAKVGLNLAEGRGVMQSDLILIVAGLVVSMYVKDKMIVLGSAVAMVVFMKLGLVVQEGMMVAKDNDKEDEQEHWADRISGGMKL